MTFDNPILFLLCSVGVLNGFLVSFYFLFFNKQKRVQNLFFGVLLLMLSIRIGKSVYVLFSEERNKLILQIGLSACFLIGVSLFYYVKSSIKNSKTIPRSWLLHIGVLLLFVTIVGFFNPYETSGSFWRIYFVKIIYSVWCLYLILSGVLLRHILKKIFSTEEKCSTPELWLVVVFVGNVLIFAAYIIGYFYLYMVGTITFSVVFYCLILFLLFKRNRESIFQDIPEKYASKKIEDIEANSLITQLKALAKEK
jgi:hypothetical protein